MIRLIPRARVLCKLFLRRVRPIPSFCKHCGRDVHDFIAPDEVWEQVEPHIRHGYTLCYECFCDLCEQLGLPSVWGLVVLERKEVRDEG